MSQGQVNLVVTQGIACIELASPPMNTLTRPMVTRLGELLSTCRADHSVRVLLVHGAGSRAFSAGSDLHELRQLIAAGEAALAGKFAQDIEVFGQLAHFPKPTIAAIEGAAIGGGLELAAGCDFIVASRSSRLALPEIHLGVFPGSGGTVRVTQRIGPARARRMMLLGERVDAATAQAWGLVDDVCDEGSALAVAMALAQRLAAGPALAYEGCKAAIDAAMQGSEAAALEMVAHWAVRLGFSDDLAEGLRAIDERRTPKFGPLGC